MWYLITTIIFGGLVMASLILNLKGRRKRNLGNRIPGPKGSLIIGSLPLLLQEPEVLLTSFLKEYRK